MAGVNRVRLWCEDRAHETFARRLLQQKRIDLRRSDFRPAPKGRGSAASWILSQCPEIGAQIRATKAQRDLGFIIIVDGDNQGFRQRLQAVKDGLARSGDVDWGRVAILIPTWSIETWFLSLTRQVVSEEQSYKSSIESVRLVQLATLAAEAWDEAGGQHPPALLDARAQLSALFG